MDWTPIVLAIIAGLPATIAAFAAFRRVGAYHKEINSRMTELLETTRQLAHAKGMADERGRKP